MSRQLVSKPGVNSSFQTEKTHTGVSRRSRPGNPSPGPLILGPYKHTHAPSRTDFDNEQATNNPRTSGKDGVGTGDSKTPLDFDQILNQF